MQCASNGLVPCCPPPCSPVPAPRPSAHRSRWPTPARPRARATTALSTWGLARQTPCSMRSTRSHSPFPSRMAQATRSRACATSTAARHAITAYSRLKTFPWKISMRVARWWDNCAWPRLPSTCAHLPGVRQRDCASCPAPLRRSRMPSTTRAHGRLGRRGRGRETRRALEQGRRPAQSWSTAADRVRGIRDQSARQVGWGRQRR